MNRALVIARFTALESWRTRLYVVQACFLGGLLLAAAFLRELALIDAQAIGAGFLAVTVRLGTVFLLSLHVASALAREFNDRGTEFLLSLDSPRGGYFAGKLGGFLVVAAGMAALATAALATATTGPGLAPWGLSLALELALVAAVTLFCAISFTQLVATLSFVFGFYLLARGIRVMQLISAAPLAGGELPQRAVSRLVEFLALLLPDLSAFCRTSWLLDASPAWGELPTLATQTAAYLALLCGAALVDLYRREV